MTLQFFCFNNCERYLEMGRTYFASSSSSLTQYEAFSFLVGNQVCPIVYPKKQNYLGFHGLKHNDLILLTWELFPIEGFKVLHFLKAGFLD